jgi:hypothetical protein
VLGLRPDYVSLNRADWETTRPDATIKAELAKTEAFGCADGQLLRQADVCFPWLLQWTTTDPAPISATTSLLASFSRDG